MKRLGITAKLVLHSALILTALGAAVTVYSVSQLRALLYQEMVQRVEAQALNWIEANTAQIILAGDPHTLDRLVSELKTREGIAYVILLDAQDRQQSAIAVRQGLTQIRSGAPISASCMCWKEMQDADGRRYFELTASISSAGTGMSPDLGTLFGAAADSPTWGELRVGVDRQEFDRGVNVLVRKNIVLTAALIFVAIALRFVLAKRMVTPITLMGRAANQIAAGNLSERVHRGDTLRDEVGDLVRDFNRMALGLQENRAEMHLLHSRLEEKVLERTHELEEANRKLKTLDQLKSDFISTVSHELRTPLTSIKAYAEILLDSPRLEPETEKHFLDIIDKEADRMSRLIADLLNLEKIKSGTTSWAMSHCDLREIIRTAAAVLAPSAAEKGIALTLHISESQRVWADPDRIQEVITNLIGNGIKFCGRHGRIEVRLRRSSVSGPGRWSGEYVEIEVTDDGPGIRPDDRDHLFEKFYQGARNSSDGSGSGLGLAISKEIVLHHRGEIWLDSRPGAGTSFYFTLPLLSPGSDSQMRPLSARMEARDAQNGARL
jgi:signal transduction histidine kinase